MDDRDSGAPDQEAGPAKSRKSSIESQEVVQARRLILLLERGRNNLTLETEYSGWSSDSLVVSRS